MELRRKIKEKRWERRHPLENKPWKEKLNHQESALDKKLREEAAIEEENERESGMEN